MANSQKKIPMFTEIKNRTILKNIFLLENPLREETKSDCEEILLVGRHIDCNLTLKHPSISRLHLLIHSNPSSQSLSVLDLSSVNGTWVSGNKIEPGVLVELKEGDTLKLGASTRKYRLHWIPITQEEEHQNENGYTLVQGSDMSLLPNVKSLTPSAPPMPDDMMFPSVGNEAVESEISLLQPAYKENTISEALLVSGCFQSDDAECTLDENGYALVQESDMTLLPYVKSLTPSALPMLDDMKFPFVGNEALDISPPEKIHRESEIPNNQGREEKRSWTMVVDTTCLLNKESRKALHLLQGLKSTNLIIPRIVIRELDFMKRRAGFFRRRTEVSAALEWIEDCLVNARSWVHIQSCEEESRPMAPTLPATAPPSHCGLMEIVSPTTEDHILEYALLLKRINRDGLVLLSNDLTLKIKAMAEGLNCETAEHFRESLVNPVSERFLWKESSPRGSSWSYADDFVRGNKFYQRGPLKNLVPAAKGFKKIVSMFWNSCFSPCN